MGEKYGLLVLESGFIECWSALFASKRRQRPPRESVVSATKCGKIITGDVESPSLLPLPLLLLMLLLVLFLVLLVLLLLLLLLLFAAAAIASL